MSKVRINDLARELEVKSRAILDTLPLVGVTEKKTHSSSLEEHEAEKVRVYIRSAAEGSSSAGKSSSRPARGEEEIKTKIDLSHISRPGRCAEGDHADRRKPWLRRLHAAVPPASYDGAESRTPPVEKPADGASGRGESAHNSCTSGSETSGRNLLRLPERCSAGSGCYFATRSRSSGGIGATHLRRRPRLRRVRRHRPV